MKILTTYSALLEMGKSFRWPTKLYYTGHFRRGVITGDLAVEAFGDPSLSPTALYNIARRLRRLGVRRIVGDMMLDRSFFDVGDEISSGFDRNKYSEYNAMPDALMIDDHLSRIIVRPQNGTITATKAIPSDEYDIINKIKPTTKACKGKYAWPYVRILTKDRDRPAVLLSGTLSTHCHKKVISKLLTHPYESFYHMFVEALHRAGIRFDGKMVLERVPPHAKALLKHRSRPLLQIIAKTNKKSNNLYARHIFLLIGAQREGAPATNNKGARTVRNILKSRGLWEDHIRIYNGCGLSRSSRVTAHALVSILRDAHAQYGMQWLNTLAVAGKDGTIKRRFRHSPARGRAWMKTGTLNNAKNIAGYVKGRSGKLYVVAILYNGREHWKGSILQNQIIEWLVRH